MGRFLWGLPVAMAAWGAGCAGPVPAPGRDEPLPERPLTPAPGAPLSPNLQSIETVAVSHCAALASGDMLYVEGDEVVRWRLPPEPAIPVGAAEDVGTIEAVVEVEGTVLVAGSTGLRVLEAEGILESPLGEALGGEALRALAASRPGAGTAELWLLTASGLHLYRDGVVREVVIDDVSLDGARMAFGATMEGRPALWLAAGGGLYALAASSSDVDAWRVRSELLADDLAADAAGALWVVTGGDVQHRAPDGTWTWFRLPSPARAVHAALTTPDAFIETDETLFHGDAAAGLFRPVGGMPAHAGWTAAANGELWLWGSSGLARARPRHHVSLLGLGAGAIVAEPLDVSIEPEEAAHVTGLAARIDGAAAPIRQMPLRVALDPEALGPGRHLLDVSVAYDDGTLDALGSVAFIAITEPLTYAEDIRPIYETSCARCHGPDGPAPTKLDTVAAWRREIGDILDNVRSGRMPLGGPRLPPESIGVIEAWAATGFME